MFSRPLTLSRSRWQKWPLMSSFKVLHDWRNPQDAAQAIFAAAVDAVRTDNLVRNVLQVPSPGNLLVKGKKYELRRNVYIVAFGKAVLGMVRAAEDVLGEHVVRGIASVPSGLQKQLASFGKEHLLPRAGSVVTVIEGARQNAPDASAEFASQQILHLLKNVHHGDIVLALVSGGGSALLPLPVPPAVLQDVLDLTLAVSRAGASINELNTVRKHIELLKGGGMASLAHPAELICLILSDIVGNPLDLIASGPSVVDTSKPGDAMSILSKYMDLVNVPPPIMQLLRANGKAAEIRRHCEEKRLSQQIAAGDRSHLSGFDLLSNVHNVLIGSNAMALETAASCGRSFGATCLVLTATLEGEARDAGTLFAHLAAVACESYAGRDPCCDQLPLPHRGFAKAVAEAGAAAWHARSPALCIIAGGETTVTVTGRGKGGRNQEMALAAAAELARLCRESSTVMDGFQVEFLSAGTDGQDGPTSVAGAYANAHIGQEVVGGRDCEFFLRNNDSYSFYAGLANGKYFVQCGLTGTNVMDVQVLVISRQGSMQ